MTAQTGPTTSADSTPPLAELYVASPAHAAVHTAAQEAVAAAFGEALLEVQTFRGETTLVVSREHIRAILTLLREHEGTGLDRLSDLTAVDYLDLGREPRFAVVYHLMSRKNLARLRLRALVPEEEPQIDSVADLFPNANWPEREVFDLFGIAFRGHPNLSRIMMPEDWDGHPLRKDYPIGAEEIDFSFNHEVVDAERAQTTREREERYSPHHPVNNF
ncbi:MAG TPA: NADH-quinone oxidoreductase subunit C [Thermomicrobiales bacterium]